MSKDSYREIVIPEEVFIFIRGPAARFAFSPSTIPRMFPGGNEERGSFMRHGKRPTRAQKIRLHQIGLNADNWLVIRSGPGATILLHKNTNRIRKIPIVI